LINTQARQQLEIQLQKVTKEKENLQRENEELKRNNLILQKGNWPTG
jgi:hypothetical protein